MVSESRVSNQLSRRGLLQHLRKTNEAIRNKQISPESEVLTNRLQNFLIANLLIDSNATVSSSTLDSNYLNFEENLGTSLKDEIKTAIPIERASILRRAAYDTAVELYNDPSREFLSIAFLTEEILEEAIVNKLDQKIFDGQVEAQATPTNLRETRAQRSPLEINLHKKQASIPPKLKVKTKEKAMSSEEAEKKILSSVNQEAARQAEIKTARKEEKKPKKAEPKNILRRISRAFSRKKMPISAEIEAENNEPEVKRKETKEGHLIAIAQSRKEGVEGINSIDFELSSRDWKNYFKSQGNLESLEDLISSIQQIAYLLKGEEKLEAWEKIKEEGKATLELINPIIPTLIKKSSPRTEVISSAILAKLGLALDNRGGIRDVDE